MTKAWGAVSRDSKSIWAAPEEQRERLRYTNQYGLGRKVSFFFIATDDTWAHFSAAPVRSNQEVSGTSPARLR